jgi:hypothetical protein
MSDPLEFLHAAVREALDILAEDYAARRGAQAPFDGDGYFMELRRMIEAKAISLELVREDGPMGGGGPGEA